MYICMSLMVESKELGLGLTSSLLSLAWLGLMVEYRWIYEVSSLYIASH
jgi:hypothetical protein